MQRLTPPAPMPAVRDLGFLDGSVLVFGGPYGNLEATEAVLDAGRALGIPPERTICTGDVVAYGADPQATAEAIRAFGMPVVMGNCEESLAVNAPDCGCGFRRGSGCDLLAARWYAYAAGHLSRGLRDWMGALPRRLRFELNGVRIVCVHGAASSINRFVFASTPANEKLVEIELSGADGIIAGHSGIPFTQIVAGRLWHNPGAIGLPANDGTPRVWYSVLSPAAPAPRGASGGIAIEHRALDYDCERTSVKMRERGLPEGYARALRTGLWPSLDVLPPRELAATGQPLRLDGTVTSFAAGIESRGIRKWLPRRAARAS